MDGERKGRIPQYLPTCTSTSIHTSILPYILHIQTSTACLHDPTPSVDRSNPSRIDPGLMSPQKPAIPRPPLARCRPRPVTILWLFPTLPDYACRASQALLVGLRAVESHREPAFDAASSTGPDKVLARRLRARHECLLRGESPESQTVGRIVANNE
jgi:hypothetical protein